MPPPSRNKPHPVEAAIGCALVGSLRHRPLLVGVSGGRDSMALLHALKRLGFAKAVACHMDHRLRGRESSEDARFVARQARSLGFALERAQAETRAFAADSHKSVEEAARDLRMAFFVGCARRRGCRRLLLAHHADDQIETCLFHFFRGSGAAGLAGMSPVSLRHGMRIFRPLLAISRSEIDAYIAEHNIPFREDRSNAETAYTRNKIRHLVIPAIREAVGDSFRGAVLRASEIFRVENEWMEACVPPVSRTLSCADLRAMPEALRHRTVLRWLRHVRVPEAGFAEIRRVVSLLDVADGPAKVSLPGNLHARRRAGEIFLGRG